MPLTTYIASAGSGKTYALTNAYLRLLLSSAATTAGYRQLLAITFTNKAAGEMKTRIVECLNALATGNDAAAARQFCDALAVSPEELRNRALSFRSAILHDYSHFSVSTIDAFFQKIVRAFLRELGLLPDFALELDAERLLDEAVDALWQEAAVNQPLRRRLAHLINQRIENGKSWNARGELKAMGSEVFKESFRSFGRRFQEQTDDADFLRNYETTLKKITAGFTKTMHDAGTKALQILSEQSIAVTDFKYKTTSFANYFNKITGEAAAKDYVPGARVLAALGDVDKWLTGDAGKDALIQGKVFPLVNPLLEQAVKCYREQFTDYLTAHAILKNFYSMALLADVANKVTAIANEENLLLISDTLYLLRDLIGDNDTPFVYEKAGVYYRSFLLDEFQDTSNMQWESLRPLLLNGLSEGGETLAVGDVKQSIYRWRNSDWRILAQGIYDDFAAFGSQRITLDTNWRSKEIIVNTNNDIFSRLPALLQQQLNAHIDEAAMPAGNEQVDPLRTVITEAYREAQQKVSPGKTGSGGYVHIETMAAPAAQEETPQETAVEKVLQRLPLLIAELQERGYAPSDIAILTRYGREGQEIANALLQYKQTSGDTAHCFDVLSQDSLYLAQAPVVRFVIAVLQCAVSPEAICKAVAERYLQRFLPEAEMTSAWLGQLLYQPMTEAIETIITHFRLHEEPANWAFLQDLQDVALAYSNRERNDIFSFLEHWKEAGEKYNLSMTDSRNAVRILTIHKSKGLQFPVVIVPFCHWSIEPKSNSLIWVKADKEPFAGPGYLPLNYTNTLAETFFSADYWLERAQSMIDNLNLLYVAFTRAESELYAFVPQPARKRENTFAHILPALLQQEKYTAGVPAAHRPTDSEAPDTFELEKYISLPCTNALRVKYVDEQSSDIDAASVRDYGILMHRAFSYIATPEDIGAAVEKLVEGGFLINDAEQRKILQTLLENALKQPGAAEWFDGSWQLFTETNLLLPSEALAKPAQLRPDRVMFRNDEVVVVDYKFGKNKAPQHIQQVEEYIACMKKMGYTRVQGYCWYISIGEIKHIKGQSII
ncbi:MAG: UvrD-helicase domain-containing protein [Prevotellaceae bacterium]|jgi:ATP-dependent exoDNAse (exonuclease V) beta subunit|nr:UvrD-helicase domain-containing protein [Prevotellaceae bacterium]